jgi:hypothetical protein
VTLRDTLYAASARSRLRVVSSPIVTKGKRELFLCGEVATASGELVPARVRGMRLNRDASPTNAPWDDAARGDLLVTVPPVSQERARIAADAALAMATDTETR